MTVQEAITRADDLKPNQYSDENKIFWLNTVEGMVFKEIISTHVGGGDIEFNGYDEQSYDTELIAPEPYSNLYVQYILSQIDYYNGETARYNNTANMFSTAYQSFADFWNREHMSNKNTVIKY